MSDAEHVKAFDLIADTPPYGVQDLVEKVPLSSFQVQHLIYEAARRIVALEKALEDLRLETAAAVRAHRRYGDAR